MKKNPNIVIFKGIKNVRQTSNYILREENPLIKNVIDYVYYQFKCLSLFQIKNPKKPLKIVKTNLPKAPSSQVLHSAFELFCSYYVVLVPWEMQTVL